MVTIAKAPGKPPLLSEARRQALRERLAQPQGCASSKAIGHWLRQEYGLAMAYQTGHRFMRYTLRAQLKVPRKSPIKTPEQAAAFQENFACWLQDKCTAVQSWPPLPAERPVRICCQDESRFG